MRSGIEEGPTDKAFAWLERVIGAAAEDIAYRYASCDRRFTYSALAAGHRRFRDRFSGMVSMPANHQLERFMP